MRGFLFLSMRNLILVDPGHRDHFKPLSWSRPVAAFRLGILCLFEKWAIRFQAGVSHSVDNRLSALFPVQIEDENFLVPGHVLPTKELCSILTSLSLGEFLVNDNQWYGARLNKQQTQDFLNSNDFNGFKKQKADISLFRAVNHLWEFFQWNDFELKQDYELLTRGRTSAEIHSSNTVFGDQIFLEEGAQIHASILNTNTGPVYLSKNAEIMEGCMVRGGLALGESAQLKMGAKIYGATTIGAGSRVGGEVNNSIIISNSNKAHDGFLGNSLLGEWCNIGADSNNSNLKNNYEEVKVWNYKLGKFERSGTIFCGLIMGDHAKCGINTMFNTGTVVGYGANVFGDGFPRQFIPDFAWGGSAGFSTFQLDKFAMTAETVMGRRQQDFNEVHKTLATAIFNETQQFRVWEKTL